MKLLNAKSEAIVNSLKGTHIENNKLVNIKNKIFNTVIKITFNLGMSMNIKTRIRECLKINLTYMPSCFSTKDKDYLIEKELKNKQTKGNGKTGNPRAKNFNFLDFTYICYTTYMTLYVIPHIRTNLKWITQSHLKAKTIKFLQENIRATFS